MSIFKATFKDYIANQIKARQNLVNSKGSRPLDVQKYVSGKSPWVKMTSFVDYGDPKKNEAPTKELAKQYVLMGGTLYPQPGDKTDHIFKLRSGILAKDSAYGTNLGSSTTDRVNLQYGIRPMPGITSVNIKSKSAYGSLREAVVKFYAWDVHQLEDLLILYMRPGYPVLLEWGNSMYIDNTSGKVVSFDTPTINCFQENLTQEAIYDALEKYRKQLSGNYDGMLGLIRNYETSMLPNGGFECTTTLISIGDVIDSIKMNNETGEGDVNEKDYKDEFELFLSGFTIKKDKRSDTVKTLITTYQNEAAKIPGVDTRILQGRNTPLYQTPDFLNNTNTNSVNTGGSVTADERYSCYMQFGYFIFLLSKLKSLYTKDGNILDIEIPLNTITGNFGDGTCIASRFSMVIDIDSCIIQNSKATIIKTDEEIGYLPDAKEFDASDNTEAKTTGFINNKNGRVKLIEFLKDGTDMGVIGNIYVNIGRMIDLYKNESKNNKGNVYLGKYIKSILKELEFSLGSINSFDIFVLENKLVIIDKHYTEKPIANKKNSNSKLNENPYGKFILNILGTDTIVKHQKIVSKIFPSQATIIAIAAQSRKNIASLQSSTYSQMNAGLKSRLFPIISDSEDDTAEKSKKEWNIAINNVKKLLDFVENQLLKFKYGFLNENKPAMNTVLNSFLVKIAKATDYKGIIPVSLEVTMDGIGGITIGEIFTINDDILPREYNDKSVGFIVTGISQDITRPEWNTTLQTQFCLLDQENLQAIAKKEADAYINATEKTFQHDRETTINSVAMYNAFVGFFYDLYHHRFNFDVTVTNNGVSNVNITYKKSASGATKGLQGAIASFNPKYQGSVITVEQFLNEIAIKSFLVFSSIFADVKAAKPDNSYGTSLSPFIDELNKDNPGYNETFTIYAGVNRPVDFITYDKIKEMILGQKDHPNKYLMWDPLNREGMNDAVTQEYISNYTDIVPKLLKGEDYPVFQQYIPDQSSDKRGEFTPKKIDGKITITLISF